MASATLTAPRPAHGFGRAARVVLSGVLAAEAVAHLARLVALAIVDVPPAYPVTHPFMVTVAAAVGGLGAALAYLLVERFARRPLRAYLPLAAAALLLSFGSVLGVRDMAPDASAAALALSPLLHALVASASVAAVLRAARPT